VDKRLILAALAALLLGYAALRSCSGGGDAPAITDDAAGRISYISQGERVDIAAHVQSAGQTIIDFGAPW
jgi:hypothetical protein